MITEELPPATAVQQRGTVAFNRQVAKDTFLIRVDIAAIARRIMPGQFVMLRAIGRTDPLLARPFALYDVIDDDQGSPRWIDIVYVVFGNGTRCLSRLPAGAELDVWGPLGNTFPIDLSPQQAEHLLIVAGGVGQTPFLAVLREMLGQRTYGGGRASTRLKKVSFAYGVRTKEYLAGVDDFTRTGVDILLATNDGSAGRQGYVTDWAKELLQSPTPPTAIFGCGPEPMLHILCDIAKEFAVPCWVSLETKMACGYGVCFSCVCPVAEENGWDYRRVCLEGPVFPAERIVW